MAINKVVYGEEVLIDLTGDSVTEDTLAKGVTAHDKSGAVITGTMPNNGAVTGEITEKETDYTVPLGFHDGSGKVGIATAEKEKIVAGNIKQGVTILGVEGTYSGNGVNLQAKTVTPSKNAQTVQADPGYDALSAVTVNAIPYTETENAAGGKTATIG